jgi:hypothetical protein
MISKINSTTIKANPPPAPSDILKPPLHYRSYTVCEVTNYGKAFITIGQKRLVAGTISTDLNDTVLSYITKTAVSLICL